ncbi:MAG: hypothetical protein KTR26_22280 [Flammeovirgaceae bacterium]|nr:hypothetical protein [Flammeovirgaceae bacterium]
MHQIISVKSLFYYANMDDDDYFYYFIILRKKNIMTQTSSEPSKGQLGVLSLVLFILSLLLFSFVLYKVSTEGNVNLFENLPVGIAFFGSILCNVAGLISAILSLVKKEATKLKFAGFFGNFVFLFSFLFILVNSF